MRTRMRGAVGAGGEKPPATRFERLGHLRMRLPERTACYQELIGISEVRLGSCDLPFLTVTHHEHV